MARLDAAECPATFGVDADVVQAHAAEAPADEDDRDLGQDVARNAQLGERDVAVGISASGRTAFALGVFDQAAAAGALRVAISCNPGSPLGRASDIAIEVETGPEVIAGSTRLQAGTVQKLVLNMLSPDVFTRLAHTHRGRMVGVVSGNDKLRARATLVVAGLGGATREDSLHALEAADGNPKVAIVILRRGVHAEEARAAQQRGGRLEGGACRRSRAGIMRTLFRGALHGAGAADSVLVEGEVITWVGRGDPPSRPDEEVVAAPGEIIAPGFIDLQVNGYAGHDAAAGADSVAALSDALPATGVTAFLPTLISAPVEVGADFAATVGAASEAQGARVLGAHIEGPFLNPSFRGAHLRAHLAEPTPENVDVIEAARPRLVTLAPELPGALAAAERLHRSGIVLAAGHTGADFAQGRKAIAAGVRFATHIYNAMPPVHHRRPGIALALLIDPRVTVGLIADGEHVHASVCEQLLRVKGGGRVALTTDQTSAAGAPPGTYALSGRPVVSDGRVVRLKDGTLAGSAASMPDLVRLMARLPGMSLSRAISLASALPARVLGERGLGRIAEGACADLVVMDVEMRIRLTMIRGVVKFRQPS